MLMIKSLIVILSKPITELSKKKVKQNFKGISKHLGKTLVFHNKVK